MSTVVARDVTGQTTIEQPKQTAPVEGLVPPQQEAKTEETKEDAQLAKRLAAIAREQKSAREARRQVDAERKALANQTKELEDLRAWKAKFGQDPLSVLNEAGISYDQLTQSVLNQPDPEITRLKQEIAAVKAANEKAVKQAEEQKTIQMTQALKQLSNETKKLVSADPDRFELLNANGEDAIETVVQLIKHDFDETGLVKSVEEAATEIEEILAEEAMRFASTKKIKSRLYPASTVAETAVPQKQALQTEKSQLTTLSNRISPPTQPMTAKVRRERAIAAMLGQLKD